jgi:formylglycine-generating enzyme required for sulfatase activity
VYRSAPWSFDLMSRIVFNPQANGYRLPVTLEWKLAASGGVYSSGFTYSGSNSVEDVAWAYGSAPWYRGPQSVGLKQPNELGFYDMHGNVSEFVWDSSDPQDGLSQSLKHIGGSFASDPFYFNWTDPIARNWNAGQWAWGGSMPGYDFIGFRVARSVGELSSQ